MLYKRLATWVKVVSNKLTLETTKCIYQRFIKNIVLIRVRYLNHVLDAKIDDYYYWLKTHKGEICKFYNDYVCFMERSNK